MSGVSRGLAVVRRGARSRRGKQVLSALVALALVAGLVWVITLVAGGHTPAPRAQREPAVAGRPARPGAAPAAGTGHPLTGQAPAWPSVASAEIDLTSHQPVPARGTAVSVTA